MPTPPPLFEHQRKTSDFVLDVGTAHVWNDPGTGKSATLLDAIQNHRRGGGGRALVLAPKAILEPSWADDCRTFTPGLSLAVATAKNRKQAFDYGTDVVVTNHDAIKAIAENRSWLKGFDFLVMDESSAYKHRSSQRSRAVAAIRGHFDARVAMTGTPNSNGLLDLWHQAFLVDDGERLGTKYYAFRAITHEPTEGAFVDWVEKDGSREAIVDLLSDITIRYKLEECHDMPARSTTTITFDLSSKLRKAYDTMAKQALLKLKSGEVSAVHRAALRTKLLQIASGAVYSDSGHEVIANDRYDLIADLCVAREHTVVAFLWHHQRDEIIKALERAGISEYAVIDGSTKDSADIVRRFQDGQYRVLLAHPQSASHGLTLTRAKTTIWASPTDDAERFVQFGRRIYRIGQTERTETILVQARNTMDALVYDRTQGKIDVQDDVLYLMETLRAEAA